MKKDASYSAWLPYYRPKTQAHVKLFCFPYAGGGASIYRSWSSFLPPEVELCSVQLTGRENRLLDKPATNIYQLVEELAVVLNPLFMESRFAFFGHSMGALISFELARYLRRVYRREPVYLFVSARKAPQLPNEEPLRHLLPEAEFLEEVRRLNGTPEAVLQNPELLNLLLPLLRADFAVCDAYIYQDDEPLSCPITAFGGLQDHDISKEDLSAWKRQTEGAFTQRFIPGNHFFLNDHPQLLIQAMMQDLFKHVIVKYP